MAIDSLIGVPRYNFGLGGIQVGNIISKKLAAYDKSFHAKYDERSRKITISNTTRLEPSVIEKMLYPTSSSSEYYIWGWYPVVAQKRDHEGNLQIYFSFLKPDLGHFFFPRIKKIREGLESKEQELEEQNKSFKLKAPVIQELNQLWKCICSKEDHKSIEWIQKINTQVFVLLSHKDFIFKTIPSRTKQCRSDPIESSQVMMINHVQLMESRFLNMKKAREICVEHNLDRLIVPSATIHYLSDQDVVIAENKLDIQKNSAHWMECLKLPEFRETIRQLTRFILIAQFSDAEESNIPLLNKAGLPRIVLVDLESMEEDPEIGISHLLGRLTNLESIDVMEKEIMLHGTPSMVQFWTEEKAKRIKLLGLK